MKLLLLAMTSAATVAGGAIVYQTYIKSDATTEPPAAIASVEDETVIADTNVPETAIEDSTNQEPTFDTLRVEPGGTMVVAGRGAPNTQMDVQIDGTTYATAETDSSGSFFLLTQIESSASPRVVSLTQQVDELDLVSDQTVLIAPTPIVEDTPSIPTTEDVVVAEVVAPANMLMSDANGIRLLSRSDAPSVSQSIVTLDMISYAPNGDVMLSGRAVGDDAVRVYVNNEPVEQVSISPQGMWEAALQTVKPGIYTLRVDEVDTDGEVVSRIETPFKKETPEAIEIAMETATQTADGAVAVKTVQAGATLWEIARERYGEGTFYVEIFDANRDKIRDPDLIYPGQVFTLPETAG